MKQKFISCLLAGTIVLGTIAGTAMPVYAADKPATSTTQPATDGPVINTSQTNYLVLQGSNFNLKDALKLTITDPTDKDLADKIKLPEIKTDKAQEYTVKLTTTDSKGKTAEKTVLVNVIGVKDSVDATSFDDLKSVDLGTLLSGKTEGLKTTIKSQDPKSNSFVLEVSNGQNSITKNVKVNIKELPPITDNKDSTSAPAVAKDKTSTKDDNVDTEGTSLDKASDGYNGGKASADATATSSDAPSKSSNLPKTGDVGVAGEIFLAGSAVVAAGGLYFKSRRKK